MISRQHICDKRRTFRRVQMKFSLSAILSGCAEILNALIEASHWHPWRVLAGYDSPERDDVCMPSTETWLPRCLKIPRTCEMREEDLADLADLMHFVVLFLLFGTTYRCLGANMALAVLCTRMHPQSTVKQNTKERSAALRGLCDVWVIILLHWHFQYSAVAMYYDVLCMFKVALTAEYSMSSMWLLKDLRRCRDYCVRFGYSGFVVVAGFARSSAESLQTT